MDALFTSPRPSVPLAFGLSAAIPGAGQAYNRDWIKAGTALVAEVTILFLYVSWRGKGVEGRDMYRRQAHTHWSPLRYAYWLNEYTDYLNQIPDGRMVAVDPVEIPLLLPDINLTQPHDWSREERLAVRSLIQEIRRVESAVYHGDTGAAFSHILPFFGEQQYYELIGKYFQYAPGWDDYVALPRDGRLTWINKDGQFIASIEPETIGSDGSRPHVSSRFYRYAGVHADANTYLRRASRITTLLIANHVLAAVDAAVFARLHNRRMQFRLGLVHDLYGGAYIAPQLSFSLGEERH